MHASMMFRVATAYLHTVDDGNDGTEQSRPETAKE